MVLIFRRMLMLLACCWILSACTEEENNGFDDVNVPYECSIVFSREARWVSGSNQPVSVDQDSLGYIKQLLQDFSADYKMVASGNSLTEVFEITDQAVVAQAQACCDRAVGLFLRCQTFLRDNDCGPVNFALRNVRFRFRRMMGSDAGVEILSRDFGDLVYTSDNENE